MKSKPEEETKNPKRALGGKENENGLTRKRKMSDEVDKPTK